MRTPMHETANAMRPGPAVNETLCQPSPPAHRLVSTKSQESSYISSSCYIQRWAKSITVSFFFHFQTMVLRKPTQSNITPELRCLHYCRLMTENIKGNTTACLPAGFWRYFVPGCVLACLASSVSQQEKKASKISQYTLDFNICLLNSFLAVETLEKIEMDFIQKW